jgi:hypothetical protein
MAKQKFNPNHKDGPVYEAEIKSTSDCNEMLNVATVIITCALNEIE